MASAVDNRGAYGVLCALPAELGSWAGMGDLISVEGGLELRRLLVGDEVLFTCVSGVGKVAATRAAEGLIRAGADKALFIVGTCGSLGRGIVPGTLVHCSLAVQADLAVRQGRVSNPDPTLLAAWEASAPGSRAVYLTSDRAVFNPWRRFWVRRRQSGPCVAEMETAAAAACAEAWGVPWVALRSVTDGAGWGALRAFKKRYPVEAGRAADTVTGLLSLIGA